MKTSKTKKNGNSTITTTINGNIKTVKTRNSENKAKKTAVSVTTDNGINTYSITKDAKGKIQFKSNVTTIRNGRVTTVVKNGKKITTTITKNDIVTVKVINGFLKTTAATITNGDEVHTYIVKKNGKAPKQFIVKLNNVNVDKVVVDKVVVDKVETVVKSAFDTETFKALRQEILNYAEVEEIDFYTALEEIAPHSQILSSELFESEIAILLDITIGTVKSDINNATRKLISQSLEGGTLRDMKTTYDLDNKPYDLKVVHSNVADYHTQGMMVQ